MHVPKKYFHDRLVLLLISTTIFLALLELVLVLISLSGTSGRLNLVQYRPNLGLSGYTYDNSIVEYISFIIFSFLVAGAHIVLSIRMYLVRRHYAIAVLAMGILLLVLSIIVSNSLLSRR